MAALTDQDRRDIWVALMRKGDWPMPFLKHEARSAVDIMDDWVDANRAAFLASLDAVTLGDATFDETGGVVEDVWTLTAHGLAVDDIVRFTAVGTGAAGYTQDNNYYVVQVTADEFTLSETKGGAVIEGTGDSAGTWTLQARRGQEFKDGATSDMIAWVFAQVVTRRFDTGV